MTLSEGSPFDWSLFCRTDIEMIGKMLHVVLIMETVAVQMNRITVGATILCKIFELIMKQTAVVDLRVPLGPMR